MMSPRVAGERVCFRFDCLYLTTHSSGILFVSLWEDILNSSDFCAKYRT